MKKKNSSFKKLPVKFLTFAMGVVFGIGLYQIPEAQGKIQEFTLTDQAPRSPTTVVQRAGYTLSYDNRTKNPLWVHEKLTANNLSGRVSRETEDFKEDPVIPKIFRSTLDDYRGSGFDRGHLAPAADHTNSQEAMSDTFYLSNMCPQNAQFNRGYWASLERYVRDLTKESKCVDVYTGPLFLPYEDYKGRRFVKYQLIGKNDVAVPTHFYKVIIKEGKSGKQEVEAYILPNKEIASEIPLGKFKSTVEKIESYAGIKF